ncbi:peroxiredoxin [Pararhodospirillum oryzae]|uniref:Thioredoxin peroxidase n=1 Tax=Pararhodospirillum oryzae TaxID=478448 RepID=A0A512HAE8_9PROT|nr:peroxiredoxin [Pararhodospirillum oryzae]GEO82434.1 alkyl hydroperoxide reductase [Pararhodospirillum oryzae]
MTDVPGCLVGLPAPDFTAPAVLGNNEIDPRFSWHAHRGDDYGLLFFYPLDFSFVCPSEIIAHNNRLGAFTERGCKVAAVSVDSQFTHLAWKRTPLEEGGLGPVDFPLVSDLSHAIARAHGVLLDERIALRASFLIDRAGIVRHQMVNDPSLGRDVDETLRVLDALIFHDTHGEVCPAGWRQGDEAMAPTPEGVAAFLTKHAPRL